MTRPTLDGSAFARILRGPIEPPTHPALAAQTARIESQAGALNDDATLAEMAAAEFEPFDVLAAVPDPKAWSGSSSPLVNIRIAAAMLRLDKPDLVSTVAGLEDDVLRETIEALGSTSCVLRLYADLSKLALDRISIAIAAHAAASGEGEH